MNAYGVVHTKYAKQIKGSADKNGAKTVRVNVALQ